MYTSTQRSIHKIAVYLQLSLRVSVLLRIRVKFRIILSEIKSCWFGNWNRVPADWDVPSLFFQPPSPIWGEISIQEQETSSIRILLNKWSVHQHPVCIPCTPRRRSLGGFTKITMFIVQICVSPVYSLHGMQAGLAQHQASLNVWLSLKEQELSFLFISTCHQGFFDGIILQSRGYPV